MAPASSGAMAERPCHSHHASVEATARRFSNERELILFEREVSGFDGIVGFVAVLLRPDHDWAAVI